MALVSIGKAAKIFGIHVDTLRLWEKQGKIKSTRTKGNHRRYDETEIRDCKMMEFLSTIIKDKKKRKEWYNSFSNNSPILSMALDYGRTRLIEESELLEFCIVAILFFKQIQDSSDWIRKNGV